MGIRIGTLEGMELGAAETIALTQCSGAYLSMTRAQLQTEFDNAMNELVIVNGKIRNHQYDGNAGYEALDKRRKYLEKVKYCTGKRINEHIASDLRIQNEVIDKGEKYNAAIINNTRPKSIDNTGPGGNGGMFGMDNTTLLIVAGIIVFVIYLINQK